MGPIIRRDLKQRITQSAIRDSAEEGLIHLYLASSIYTVGNSCLLFVVVVLVNYLQCLVQLFFFFFNERRPVALSMWILKSMLPIMLQIYICCYWELFSQKGFYLLFQESISKTKQKIYRKVRTKIVPVRETSDVKTQQ